MSNNKSVNEYIVPKFNPMTCTIQELTMHWKDYTNSEPIWNEVRDEIYQQGVSDTIAKLEEAKKEIRVASYDNKIALEHISNSFQDGLWYAMDIIEKYLGD